MNKILKRFRFKFQSILHKMLASFSVIIFLIIAIIAVSVGSSYRASQQSNHLIQEQVPTMWQLDQISINFMERNKVAYEYIVTGNNTRIEDFNYLTEEAEVIGDTLLEISDDPEIEKMLEVSNQWSEDVKTKVINERALGNDLVATSNLNQLNSVANSIDEIYERKIERLGEEMAVVGQETHKLQNLVVTVTITLGLIAVVISGLVAWFSSKSIVDPVKEIQGRLEEFMNEDFGSPLLEINSEDEIGQLANALNATQRYLIHLMDSIRSTVDTLTSTSQDVARTGQEVETGTHQITATMQELASGAEAQANSASSLANEMDVFAEIIKEAYAHSQEINHSSEDISQKAQEGNQLMNLSTDQMRIVNNIVQEAVDQMHELNNQTDEISKLVDMVNNIANQTNLLALNASIEAARAGEQGRGFAVVADEVRKLAEEVGTSVTEITNYVKEVQDNAEKVSMSLQGVNAEVEIGTIQIQATDENIAEITNSVSSLQQQNIQMTSDLDNISERSQEMNTSIDEIASVSQESAAGVEETSASTEEITSSMEEVNSQSENLAKIADELHTLIMNVKVGDA